MGDYSRPIAELLARMAFHTLAGQTPARLLQGLTFYPRALQRTEGQSSLPYCEFKGWQMQERYRSSALVIPTMTMNFEVANERTLGHDALATWVEKVMDAIETDTTGTINTNLNGTRRPFDMNISQNFALDLSLNAVISVIVEPLITERGKRRT